MTCWYSDDITTAASKLEFCSGALLATSVLAPQHWTLLLIATLIWNSQPCPIKVPHRVIQGLFLINNLHLQCIQSGTAQYYWAYPHMSAGPRCISFKVVSRTVKTRVRKTKFYMALIKTWLSLHQILYFTLQSQLANALPSVVTPLTACAVTQLQEEVTLVTVLVKAEDYNNYFCVIGLLLKQIYI